MDDLTAGVVEAHFLHCPHCHGYADLETHCCSSCGAEAITVVWGPPTLAVSPELTMVSRRR